MDVGREELNKARDAYRKQFLPAEVEVDVEVEKKKTPSPKAKASRSKKGKK